LGEPGEEKVYVLELSVLSDVGLVGKPNAGKSTFLSVVSAARPKVDSYPFTTLEPVLGYVKINEEADFVIADIPGLIEGAHEGKGLGIRFLQHILRVRVLLFLLDVTEVDPIESYKILQNELSSFSPVLQKKKKLIAFTKLDLLEGEKEYLEGIKEGFLRENKDLSAEDVFFISSVKSQGIRKLLYRLSEILNELPKTYGLPQEIFSAEEEFKVFKLEDSAEIKIEKISANVWKVSNKEIERLANISDFENEESFYKFLREMEKRGVDSLLQEKGIQIGDTVIIGGKEFLWVE
jgi:GTP-binding protein